MAQRTGKDFQIAVIGGYDIRPTMAEMPTFRREKVIEDTTVFGTADQVQKSTGLRKAALSERGFFNDDALSSVDALMTTFSSDTPVTGMFGLSGNTLGAPVTMFSGILEANVSRQVKVGTFTRIDAEYAITGNSVAVDEGTLLAAQQTITGAGPTTVYAADASTPNGATCYLQVNACALGGYTNWIVIVEHSADNAIWATLVTFTAITAAPFTDRQLAVGTINRFTRITASLTGGGAAPSLTFSVGMTRNSTATSLSAAAMTLSGGIINDAMRTAALTGDGRTAPAGVGIFPTTTNLVKNSGAETSPTTNNAVTGTGVVTLTRDTTAGKFKFGAAAFKLVCDGSAAGQGLLFQDAAGVHSHMPVTQNLSYAVSAWLLGAAGGETVTLGIRWFDNAGVAIGSVVASSTLVLTAAYARYRFAATAPTGATEAAIQVVTVPLSAQTFWIDGVQFEQQGAATPYVVTDGATGVRAAPVVTGPSAALAADQAWVAVCISPSYTSVAGPGGGSGIHTLFDWNNAGTDEYKINLYEADQTIGLTRLVATVSTSTGTVAQVWTLDQNFVVIGEWTAVANIISTSLNGLTVSTASTGAPSGLPATFTVGYASTNANYQFGRTLWAAMGLGTLTAADRAALLAFTATIPTWATLAALAATVRPTLLWTAVDGTVTWTQPRAERPEETAAIDDPNDVPAPPADDATIPDQAVQVPAETINQAVVDTAAQGNSSDVLPEMPFDDNDNEWQQLEDESGGNA